MKRLYCIFGLAICFSLAQPKHVCTVGQDRSPADPTPANELGVIQYPLARFLPEATERLTRIKSESWLLAKVFHTDSSIKEVAAHFRMQAEIENKQEQVYKSVRWLLWDNWNIQSYKVSQAPTVYGLGDQLKQSTSAEEVKSAFGVFFLSDSLLRVYLMSPHPSADNNKLEPGTMITIVKEPLPEYPTGDDQKIKQKEKIYYPKEVDQKIRIWSQPRPAYPRTDRAHTVSLKAVFSKSGKVTNIEVIGRLDEFARAAIEAARRIKFEPAIKDGRYVSQHVRLDYNYSP